MLADDIAWALPQLRAEAEARMLDTFDIGVPTGGWVFDPDIGEDVEEITPLFTTKGRVKSSRSYGTLNEEVGGRTATTVTRELHIPVGSPAVPIGAVADVAAVDPTSDPTLLNARLRLSGPSPGSQTTARRLEVTEVLS